MRGYLSHVRFASPSPTVSITQACIYTDTAFTTPAYIYVSLSTYIYICLSLSVCIYMNTRVCTDAFVLQCAGSEPMVRIAPSSLSLYVSTALQHPWISSSSPLKQLSVINRETLELARYVAWLQSVSHQFSRLTSTYSCLSRAFCVDRVHNGLWALSHLGGSRMYV